MSHPVRAAARGLYAGPPLLMGRFQPVAPMVGAWILLLLWVGAGGIYSMVVPLPQARETAAVVLGLLDAFCSWRLTSSFLKLASDLRDLRVPTRGTLLMLGPVLVLVLACLVPSTLVWWLHGSAQDVLIAALGSITGTAAALARTVGSRERTEPCVAADAARFRVSRPVRSSTPWQALLTALGPPFAPVSWSMRLLQVAGLCAIVAGLPMLLELLRGAFSARVFSILLHIAQFAVLLPAIGLCWIWPLSRMLALFVPAGGVLAELALLPGLGGPRQQLRRLFLAALSAPAAALLALLCVALCVAVLQHESQAIMIKLVVGFFLIPLITLPMLAAMAVKPPTRGAGSAAALIFAQVWTFTVIVWSGAWEGLAYLLPHWVFIAIPLGALSVALGTTAYFLRKLSARPHPFVEVTQ